MSGSSPVPRLALRPFVAVCAMAAALCRGLPARADEAPRFDAARCAVPQALATQAQPLNRVAFKLRNDMPIKIVAVGSSSTAGHGASTPQHSYPARLAEELRALWPRARVDVVNRGVGGERSHQMVARFERDVLSEQPDLVIWQVGTNSAWSGHTVDMMHEIVIEGIDMLQLAGTDVILMSPQYAPRFNEKVDHLLRVEAVRAAADVMKVAMFRRFEIMQSWIARGQMKMETMLSEDGLHLNDLSYGCVAHLLARQVADASRAIPAMAVRQRAPIPTANAMASSPMTSLPTSPAAMSAPAMTTTPIAAAGVLSPAIAAREVAPVAAPIAPNTRW